MKMDMSGAAAVLAAMSALQGAAAAQTAVTGYLMCTDNMPSGSAMKLGDVLTMRNGKTVEVHNTDAEGRLVLADGLSLAVEERAGRDRRHRHAHRRLPASPSARRSPALLGNDQALRRSGRRPRRADVDEPVWQLPLDTKRYRKLLDSDVADMKNIGGPYGGAITAALFLTEFVGDVPWAHLDIAGPMNVDADEGSALEGRHRLRHPPPRSTSPATSRHPPERRRLAGLARRRADEPERRCRRRSPRRRRPRRRRRAGARSPWDRRRRRPSPSPGGGRGSRSSSVTVVAVQCGMGRLELVGHASQVAVGDRRDAAAHGEPVGERMGEAEHHAPLQRLAER